MSAVPSAPPFRLVRLLSDALESVVNLAAALVAILMLHWATLTPDEQHRFGHEKRPSRG